MNTARPMMDRRLKERLVGATILVALIVLIVPELLSGPKHPGLPPLAAGLTPSRSVVVDLATSKAIAEPESGAASQAAPAEAAHAGAASSSDREFRGRDLECCGGGECCARRAARR